MYFYEFQLHVYAQRQVRSNLRDGIHSIKAYDHILHPNIIVLQNPKKDRGPSRIEILYNSNHQQININAFASLLSSKSSKPNPTSSHVISLAEMKISTYTTLLQQNG